MTRRLRWWSAHPDYRSKSLWQTVQGWRHPLRGLKVAFLAEGSFRWELLGLVVMIGGGVWLNFSLANWVLVLTGFSYLLSAELSNSTEEMNQRLANPRQYVKRRVRRAALKPPPLTRMQRRVQQWLGLPAATEADDELDDEFTIEVVPVDNEAVRNIYDVAAAQVVFPLLLTIFLSVHALVWPQAGL